MRALPFPRLSGWQPGAQSAARYAWPGDISRRLLPLRALQPPRQPLLGRAGHIVGKLLHLLDQGRFEAEQDRAIGAATGRPAYIHLPPPTIYTALAAAPRLPGAAQAALPFRASPTLLLQPADGLLRFPGLSAGGIWTTGRAWDCSFTLHAVRVKA